MAMHGSHLQAGDVTEASRPRAKSVPRRRAGRSGIVPLGGQWRTSTFQLTAPTRPTGCPQPPKAADGRWSVSCGVEARRGVNSCFPALHPRGVGVGGSQRPTNCSQRQAARPRVRAGGWYRFHQLVGRLEHSALRAQIGVRTETHKKSAGRPRTGGGAPTNCSHGLPRRAPDGYGPGGAAGELVEAQSRAVKLGWARYSVLRAGVPPKKL